LAGGNAPTGGGVFIRLFTVIPPARSPRLSLSTIPEGAILTHTVGNGDGVTVALSAGDTVADALVDTDIL